MYYQVNERKSTPSPIPLRKLSQYHVPNTYFQSVKPPQERQFEPIEKQKTLIDFNELKDQEIYRLNKYIELLQEEKQKMRSTIEQQSIYCAAKEQEIQQLICKQHQIQREYNLQIQQLRGQVDQMYGENMRMIEYIKEISKDHQKLQQQYQDIELELQEASIYQNMVNLLQEEIKGKQEEINILKSELQVSTKLSTESCENQQIFDFLNEIKQQYHEKSECESVYSVQQDPIYSFQTKTDNF